jgi:hypothetical protein
VHTCGDVLATGLLVTSLTRDYTYRSWRLGSSFVRW